MERLVPIAFGVRDPVTEAIRIGLVKVSYDRIYLPTCPFFVFVWCVNDDAYGKKVINVIEANLVLFYLVNLIYTSKNE